MNPVLRGVRAKIDRAKKHFNDIHAAVNTWGNEVENQAPIAEHDPENKLIKFLASEKDTGNPFWALMLGDLFHNLRSSLDHLIVQLAILNGNDITAASKTFFPICLTNSDFKSSIKRFKHLLSKDALAAIRRAQPYVAAKALGENARESNLWIISKLDNIDKHRMLMVIRTRHRTRECTVTINDQVATSKIVTSTWKSFNAGAVMATVDLSDFELGPRDKVGLNLQTELRVFIDEPCLGIASFDLTRRLRTCIDLVACLVDEFGREFFLE